MANEAFMVTGTLDEVSAMKPTRNGDPQWKLKIRVNPTDQYCKTLRYKESDPSSLVGQVVRCEGEVYEFTTQEGETRRINYANKMVLAGAEQVEGVAPVTNAHQPAAKPSQPTKDKDWQIFFQGISQHLIAADKLKSVAEVDDAVSSIYALYLKVLDAPTREHLDTAKALLQEKKMDDAAQAAAARDTSGDEFDDDVPF